MLIVRFSGVRHCVLCSCFLSNADERERSVKGEREAHIAYLYCVPFLWRVRTRRISSSSAALSIYPDPSPSLFFLSILSQLEKPVRAFLARKSFPKKPFLHLSRALSPFSFLLWVACAGTFYFLNAIASIFLRVAERTHTRKNPALSPFSRSTIALEKFSFRILFYFYFFPPRIYNFIYRFPFALFLTLSLHIALAYEMLHSRSTCVSLCVIKIHFVAFFGVVLHFIRTLPQAKHPHQAATTPAAPRRVIVID